MILASLCVVLLVVGTLLAYVAVPLPLTDPFFAWIRRQWLFEGIGILSCLGFLSVSLWFWRRNLVPTIPWWRAWCVWLVWAAISAVWSIDPGLSMRSWLMFSSYGLLAFMARSLIQSSENVRIWTRFLVVVAAIVSLEGLFQYLWTFEATLPLYAQVRQTQADLLYGWGGEVLEDFLIRRRIISVFGWPNLFAGFLLLTIPLAIASILDARRRWQRFMCALVAVLLSVCLVLTLSMGAWIAAVFTGGLAWWLLRSVKKSQTASFQVGTHLVQSIGLVLVVVAVICVTSFIVASRARPLILGSVSSRVIYVLTAGHILRAHPFLGTGLGTFGLAYWSMMPPEYATGQHSAIHAHNTLAELAVELGLIGLALFGWFLWQVGRMVIRSLNSPNNSDHAILLRGLTIGVTGFFLYSLIEQTFFEAVTAPFWWLGLGLLTGATSFSPASQASSGLTKPRFSLGLIGVVSGLVLFLFCRLIMADAWAAHGALQDLSGRRQEAMNAFTQAQRWDSLTSRYPLEQAERLLKWSQDPLQTQERVQDAENQLERVVTLSPWRGYAWQRLGLVRWQLGKIDSAIQAMKEAVKWDPNSSEALRHLAYLLHANQEFGELTKIARQLQKRQPINPEGWFLEALAWQGLGNIAQARQTYEQIIQNFPTHYPTRFNLATLLRNSGDVSGASVAYQTFLNIAPSDQVDSRRIASEFVDAHEVK